MNENQMVPNGMKISKSLNQTIIKLIDTRELRALFWDEIDYSGQNVSSNDISYMRKKLKGKY